MQNEGGAKLNDTKKLKKMYLHCKLISKRILVEINHISYKMKDQDLIYHFTHLYYISACIIYVIYIIIIYLYVDVLLMNVFFIFHSYYYYCYYLLFTISL